jgi:DNA modification methylase
MCSIVKYYIIMSWSNANSMPNESYVLHNNKFELIHTIIWSYTDLGLFVLHKA